MIFLSVLLKILQIIGIIILSILAFVLLVILIVLFVPIRYKAKGSYHEKVPKVKADVTWLMGIVNVSFELGRTKPLLIKIFGIKINDKKEKPVKNKKKKKAESPNAEQASLSEQTTETEASKTESVITSEPNKSERVVSCESVNDESIVSSYPVEPESETEKASSEDVMQTEPEKTDGKNEKTIDDKHGEKSEADAEVSATQKPKFYDKLKKYLEVIQSDCFKKAFSLSKRNLGKIFKHILPRKWDITGSISLADPSATAKIFEISSMLYPWTYKHVHLSTDFDGEHIDVDGYLKGHITLIRLVWLAANVYFNRNIKKLIKLFKEI